MSVISHSYYSPQHQATMTYSGSEIPVDVCEQILDELIALQKRHGYYVYPIAMYWNEQTHELYFDWPPVVAWAYR